jgi:DNA-binding SARP family transcriptional activator
MDETGPMALSLLGGFALSVGGEVIPGISAECRRLLAFLALHGRVSTRAHVAGTLWPESTDERAHDNLRSAIACLNDPARRAVKPTADNVGLSEDVVVDVHRSNALAHRLIDPDAAPDDTDLGGDDVSALSKDLLPGWYDDWALIAAADWRWRRLEALEALAARLTAAGRLPEAGAAALSAVRAEPLRESARAALIRVRIAERNETEAVRELERYRDLLQAELGLEPTPRLSQLLGDVGQR